MCVAHLYPSPYFPPTYYTFTTFPHHVATAHAYVHPKTAVMIKIRSV